MSEPAPPWDEWDDYANCYVCRFCGAAAGYGLHNSRCPERPVRIRPMRGQVVVREIREHHALWRPTNPRDVKIHRGRVLALGAPARTRKGAEVPYEFGVGDVVLYSFAHHEAAHTRPWSDGQDATWVPQVAVSAVVECGDVCGAYRCTLQPGHSQFVPHKQRDHRW